MIHDDLPVARTNTMYCISTPEAMMRSTEPFTRLLTRKGAHFRPRVIELYT